MTAIAVQPGDSLVELQNSYKAIRNPFGFDFVHTWNKTPLTLKGDGNWYSFLEPLAVHMIYHLSTRIANAWHDRQVSEAQAKGNEQLVKKLKGMPIPDDVRNKIHIMITGENHPRYSLSTGEIEAIEMDFSFLDKSLAQIQAEAGHAVGPQVSIDPMLARASQEALDQFNASGGTGMINGGVGAIGIAPPLDTSLGNMPVDAIPGRMDMNTVPAQAVQSGQPASAPQSEFGDLRVIE